MRRLVGLCCVVVLLAAGSAAAVPVELDATFGAGGMARTPLTTSPAAGLAVAVQADGRVLVGGRAGDAQIQFVLGSFLVARFLPDGTLDPTFGDGGVAMTVMATPSNVRALAIQPDGHVLAGGFVQLDSATSVFAIARYTADGILDPTFGDGGVALSPHIGTIEALVVQPDGRIVAAGGNFPGAPFAGLVRYDADGSVDATFGVNGVAAAPSAYLLTGLVRQADGALVAAGFHGNNLDTDLFVGRWDADGQPDPGFGSDGEVVTDLGGTFDELHDLLVQPDGRLLGIGTISGSAGASVCVVRYLDDGTLDPSFGTNGVGRIPIPDTPIQEADGALQPDGRVVVATSRIHFLGVASSSDGVLRRFLPNGAPDPTFEFADGGPLPMGDDIRDVSMDADGRIVGAGLRVLERQTFPPFGPTQMVAELRRWIAPSECGDGDVDVGEDCESGQCCDLATCRFLQGTSCSDGNACTTGDVCTDGACGGTPTPPLPCRSCDPATGLQTPAPRTDCRRSVRAGGSTLTVRDPAGTTRDRLIWSWKLGEATTLAELGDPFADVPRSHELCIFGPDTTPVLAAAIEPENGSCGKPCWKASAKALKYRARPANAAGVASLVLTAGIAGKTTAKVVMAGAPILTPNASVPIPDPPPMATPLRVQLRAIDGACWEATYSAAGVTRNEPGRFGARAD